MSGRDTYDRDAAADAADARARDIARTLARMRARARTRRGRLAILASAVARLQW